MLIHVSTWIAPGRIVLRSLICNYLQRLFLMSLWRSRISFPTQPASQVHEDAFAKGNWWSSSICGRKPARPRRHGLWHSFHIANCVLLFFLSFFLCVRFWAKMNRIKFRFVNRRAQSDWLLHYEATKRISRCHRAANRNLSAWNQRTRKLGASSTPSEEKVSEQSQTEELGKQWKLVESRHSPVACPN